MAESKTTSSGAKPKRRLPVLSPTGTPQVLATSPSDQEEAVPDRPAWQWLLIAAIATLLGWLILAMIGNGLLAWLGVGLETSGARGLAAVVNAVGFGVAAFGAGSLVGRFGGQASSRTSAEGGALAALIGVVMAASTSPIGGAADLLAWLLIAAVIAGIGAVLAWLGDRANRRRPPA